MKFHIATYRVPGVNPLVFPATSPQLAKALVYQLIREKRTIFGGELSVKLASSTHRETVSPVKAQELYRIRQLIRTNNLAGI